MDDLENFFCFGGPPPGDLMNSPIPEFIECLDRYHFFSEEKDGLSYRVEKLFSFLLNKFYYEHIRAVYNRFNEKPDITVNVEWKNIDDLYNHIDQHLAIFKELNFNSTSYTSLLSALTCKSLSDEQWLTLLDRIPDFQKGGVSTENIITLILPHLFDGTARELSPEIQEMIPVQESNWNNIYNACWSRFRERNVSLNGIDFVRKLVEFSISNNHTEHLNYTIYHSALPFLVAEIDYLLALDCLDPETKNLLQINRRVQEICLEYIKPLPRF